MNGQYGRLSNRRTQPIVFTVFNTIVLIVLNTRPTLFIDNRLTVLDKIYLPANMIELFDRMVYR